MQVIETADGAGAVEEVGRVAGRRALVADSVSFFAESGVGAVLVTGSHGGASAGEYAVRFGAFALVCNDAGWGKNDAGIAGLSALDGHAVAGVGVSHLSARIGEGHDLWEHGVVSYANSTATALGVRIGSSVPEAVAVLLAADRAVSSC